MVYLSKCINESVPAAVDRPIFNVQLVSLSRKFRLIKSMDYASTPFFEIPEDIHIYIYTENKDTEKLPSDTVG